MGWIDFDWLDFERDEFGANVRTVIVELFDNATRRLDELWKVYEEKSAKRLMEAKTDDDRDIAWNLAAWEEHLHRQRHQALGSLALDWLMSALRARLGELKRYFDKTHPPGAEPYQGADWLSRTAREYLERFGIDFQQSPVPFHRIQELVLARNAGVHREGTALGDYRAKIGLPRFFDERNQDFWVAPERFHEVVGEAEAFVAWVVAEMKKVRQEQAGSQ